MHIADISITKKIFFCTSLTLVVYLIGSVIGQSLLYERAYTYQKQWMLIHQTERFAEEYLATDDRKQINQKIIDYSNEYKANILVMNEGRNIIHAVTYELILHTDENTDLRLQLDSAVSDPTFRALGLKEGDRVSVEYISGETGGTDVLYMPNRISANGAEWTMRRNNHTPFENNPRRESGKPRADMLRSAEGTVVSVTMPSNESAVSMIDRAQLMDAAWQWFSSAYTNAENDENGETKHDIYKSPDEDKYVVVVKPVEKYGEHQTIVSITTLEPVRAAANVMREMQFVILLLGIVIITAVCILLSRYITRPIVNISKVTAKMTQLDFSEKCRIHSQDEFGQLAQNINSMSDTLDRTITELRAANKKLKLDIERERDIEKNRREFTAAVSHELKTPLAIIRAYSEALRDGVSANKQERYISVIVDEIKKMDALVLDMLENSKLESGVQQLNIKEHDLCDLIRKITRRFEKNIADKQLHVQQRFSAEKITAQFDRDRLEQVITNFITNAIRHTPDGGNITIYAAENEKEIEVAIENEGAHIHPSEIERIWDRFYKIDKSRGRALGGTGLGLSIAKNVLILHHASYGAENTQTGVRFWFRLQK